MSASHSFPTPTMAPLTRRAGAAGVAGTLAAAAILAVHTPVAQAHDADLAIGAKKLSISTRKDPAKQKFRFATSKQIAIGIAHDPGQVGTWLLVRGYGPYGGATGRINLDPALWQSIGSSSSPKGFKYSDRDGSRGGIQKILLKSGKLVVKGGGQNWPWRPAGAQTSVWFFFGIEDESWCASFGGDIKRNEAGSFDARSPVSPGACPSAICGNAEVELGQDCDDGNLQDADGCTADCESSECSGTFYDSTWKAIQQLVFEQNSCTNLLCHGGAPGQGGLDLSTGAAYANLLEVPSAGSALHRVEPASPNSSSLYLKLLKAADPTVDIAGDPMPTGLPAIDPNLLEAVRIWILSGAPETGTVSGTETLLGGCFPAPGPISIAPLQPPDPADGFQLEMPATPLSAQSEIEVCFATYYDVTDTVPAQYKDPGGGFFYANGDLTRQDPHSHHLVIMHSTVSETLVNDPSFGGWTCIGGDDDGAACDPIDTSSCGDGLCRASIGNSVACIGYGPPGGPFAGNPAVALGGAGNGQTATVLPAGQYRRLPLKGFVYWNVHAFNLTPENHQLKAYLNLLYTDDTQYEVKSFTDFHDIYIAAGQAPYSIDTYCSTRTFPRGTRLTMLSSHTHQRGEVFWVNDPSGTEIYRSFIYNDPVIADFDPPMAFDSTNAAARRLTYCATYNNGVAPDGSADPSAVRKRSVTPQNASLCFPTACTTGNVGGTCSGPSDHATCDSSPGAGDGFCDACAISAGVSTEDEMFVLTGRTYEVTP